MNLQSSIKFDGQYGWRPTVVQPVELKGFRWTRYLVFLWETEDTRRETRWKEIPASIRTTSTTSPRGDVQEAGDYTCGLSMYSCGLLQVQDHQPATHFGKRISQAHLPTR